MTRSTPIEVRQYGVGLPIVVLHGGPGAPGSAGGLARALADEFRVHEPWQRARDDTPLSVARHVEDLAAAAPDRSVLVGWSWGAMLALSYGSLHPERVRGIALVGCGTYDTTSRAHYQDTLQAALGPEGRRESDRLRRSLDGATEPAERNALWAAFGELMAGAQSVDLLPAKAYDQTFDQRGADETWQDVLRLQAEGVEPQRFAAIRCPVLMLHGYQDPHPGARTHEVLQRYVPQIEYVALDECGHEPWRERHAREAFFAALRPRLRTWCAN